MKYLAILPVVLVALAGALTERATPADGVAVAASCKWTPVKPAVADQFVVLNAVDGVSAAHVWAVGSQRAGGAPIVLRRTDGKWATVDTPSRREGVLRAVSARTPNDVWAVGSQLPPGAPGLRTLIQHFDGTRWRVVPSPNKFKGTNVLNGVVAIAANDVWAVGGNGLPGSRAMILHYDGVRWSIHNTPAIPPQADLTDIDIVAGGPAKMVAVGRRGGTSDRRQLVLSYDGTSWKRDTVNDPQQNSKEFDGVSGDYAVGSQSGSAVLRTFAMRRTSPASPGAWRPVTSQNSGKGINVLFGVSARKRLQAERGFAVGYFETPGFTSRTLILELKDKPVRWTKVGSPNLTSLNNRLSDVYMAPLGGRAPVVQAWAVGTASKPIGSVPIVLEYLC